MSSARTTSYSASVTAEQQRRAEEQRQRLEQERAQRRAAELRRLESQRDELSNRIDQLRTKWSRETDEICAQLDRLSRDLPGGNFSGKEPGDIAERLTWLSGKLDAFDQSCRARAAARRERRRSELADATAAATSATSGVGIFQRSVIDDDETEEPVFEAPASRTTARAPRVEEHRRTETIEPVDAQGGSEQGTTPSAEDRAFTTAALPDADARRSKVAEIVGRVSDQEVPGTIDDGELERLLAAADGADTVAQWRIVQNAARAAVDAAIAAARAEVEWAVERARVEAELQARRDADALEAIELLESLGSLQSPDLEVHRSDLQRVIDGKVQLNERLRSQVSTARRAAEQAILIDVLTAAGAELTIAEVGGDSETVRGRISINGGWSSIVLDAHGLTMTATTDRQLDDAAHLELDERNCELADRIDSGAGERGLEVTTRREIAPGGLPPQFAVPARSAGAGPEVGPSDDDRAPDDRTTDDGPRRRRKQTRRRSAS